MNWVWKNIWFHKDWCTSAAFPFADPYPVSIEVHVIVVFNFFHWLEIVAKAHCLKNQEF